MAEFYAQLDCPVSVACTGAAVVDVLVRAPRTLPAPGESKIVDAISLAPGGCGINTAIGLARLGVDVSFWARLGADGAGDFLRNQLEGHRVRLDNWQQSPERTTKSAVVLVSESGERAFLRTSGGGNALSLDDFEHAEWSGIRHLHVGGCYSLRRLLDVDLAQALRLARAYGVTTSVDTVWSHDDNWDTLLPALPWVDHLLPSLAEARRLTGEQDPEAICAWLHGRGVTTVVVKLGARGAFFSTTQDRAASPAFAVPGGRVVDTTGAGDAFCAGYIAALQVGRPLPEAVRWANAWAAIAVSALGATTALHDREQLMDRLEEGVI
ncbi:MAG: carbohydrate kinase family protein [Gemmatimonadaceae bacterium]|nr:carbohydrate kinase family protein [Gloeobacterales cyanobacterium ES-bin-141]